MKNINKIGGLLLTSLLATGCYYEPISDYSSMADFAWLSGADNNNYNPTYLVQGDILSLLNCSQNALSATWTVPEDSGIYFLSDEITYKEDDPDTDADESSSLDYDAMIVDHDYSFNDDKNAFHVYFTEAGSFDIVLRCTFDKEVSWKLTDPDMNDAEVVYTSTYENGVHVAERVITVFVFTDSLDPVVEVTKDGQQLTLGSYLALTDEDGNVVSMDTSTIYGMAEYELNADDVENEVLIPAYDVYLKYGESLSFSEFSTSDYEKVDVRTWACSNPVLSSTADAPTFTFKPNSLIEPGVDTCKVYITLTRWGSGTTYSEMNSSRTRVPINIFVEENTEDLTITSSMYDNDQIRVTLGNGKFDTETITGEEGEDFVVTYKNGSYSGEIAVDSVYYAGTNAQSVLCLDLAEYIYNTDEITLNYNGNSIGVLYNDGSFAFTDLEVTTAYSEPFTFDFEDPSSLDDWQLISQDLSLALPATPAELETESGNTYISIEPDIQTYDGDAIYFMNTGAPFSGNMGNYTLTGRVRSTDCTANMTVGIGTRLDSSSYLLQTGWMGTQYIYTSTFTPNEWTDFTITFTATYAVSDVWLNLSIGNTLRGKLDFDDLVLTNKEERPDPSTVTE